MDVTKLEQYAQELLALAALAGKAIPGTVGNDIALVEGVAAIATALNNDLHAASDQATVDDGNAAMAAWKASLVH